MPPPPLTCVALGRADLAPGTMRGHQLGPERFVLLVNLDGRYHAIDDWCNHAGCLLSNGRLVDGAVECPCHGAQFRIADGALQTSPRICEDQDSYPVFVADGQVYAELTSIPLSPSAAGGEGRGEGGT
jgi:3-phenylpropionate/trans-cinnamate dioxygenase ferredoxin component